MREIGYELEAVTGFWHHYLDASWYPEPALLTWLSLVNNGNHLSQLTVECQFGKPHYSVPEDFEVTFFDVEYDQEAQCMVYDWHCIRPANDNPEDDYYE